MKNFKILIAYIVMVTAYFSISAFISSLHETTAPSIPVLVSPAGTGISLTPLLLVNNSTGGTGARLYDFQLTGTSDVNFSNPIVRVSDIMEGASQTSYQVPSGKLNSGQTYIWKVECHASGEFSGYSQIVTFTTQ